MVTTRASKRRRKNQNDATEEDVQEHPPQAVHDDGRKSPDESPVVVLAHGAGAPSSSDWMIKWKGMLAKTLQAIEVLTFDYPYIAGGKRRAPPKAEKLVDFHCEIVRKAIAKYPGHPLVLAGKSMGSRVSCMVAGEKDIAVSAVVCLGYPLKGARGAVRDDTLLQLKVPVMFVQVSSPKQCPNFMYYDLEGVRENPRNTTDQMIGSKDGLCPLEKLEVVRKKMHFATELHVIEGGDHSFKIGKKHLQSTGSNQEEAEQQAVEAIAAFVLQNLKAR